jgi:hypothetical protein
VHSSSIETYQVPDDIGGIPERESSFSQMGLTNHDTYRGKRFQKDLGNYNCRCTTCVMSRRGIETDVFEGTE